MIRESEISNKESIFYVYMLIDPRDSAVFYVGKGVKGRIHVHESLSRYNKHYNKHIENKIHNIWDCGKTVIKKVLLKTYDEEEAFVLEKEIIDNIGLENLCNLEAGDRHRYKGYKHSDETKRKLTEINGKNSKKKETRDKISKTLLKRYEDPNERKKISDATKLAMTPEARKKMSEAKKGKRSVRYNKVTRVCEWCSKHFVTSPSHKRRFCSRKCYVGWGGYGNNSTKQKK